MILRYYSCYADLEISVNYLRVLTIDIFLPQNKFVLLWYVNIVVLTNVSKMEKSEINSDTSVKKCGVNFVSGDGRKKYLPKAKRLRRCYTAEVKRVMAL
jgi:hypothetical protein